MSISAEVSPGYRILADLVKPYDLEADFGNNAPMELEIGAGRGDFAISYCAENPDRNLLAIERKLNYLKRGVNKAIRKGVPNLRFLNVEARHFLEEYIPPQSLAVVHIYFPDPWPKKKQNKRRIIQGSMMDILAARLVPGGYLHLRTDHVDYFDQMMQVMGEQPSFRKIDVPEHVTRHLTGFEKRFREDGIDIHYASYQLVDRSNSSHL